MANLSSVLSIKTAGQFVRFITVGACATATHAGTLILFVEVFSWDPVLLTPVAFCLAVSVSYVGSYYWTFSASSGLALRLPKFAIVQCIGMLLNTIIMHFAYNVLVWDYRVGLLIAIAIVPLCVFSLHKFWTFSDRF